MLFLFPICDSIGLKGEAVLIEHLFNVDSIDHLSSSDSVNIVQEQG